MAETNLNILARVIHDTAKSHGFWEEERNFGEMLALMHSELSEALESHRKGESPIWLAHAEDCQRNNFLGKLHKWWYRDEGKCTCLPKPEGWAVELGDAMIRILDTLYGNVDDIDGMVLQKMYYNDSRPYKHGKAY